MSGATRPTVFLVLFMATLIAVGAAVAFHTVSWVAEGGATDIACADLAAHGSERSWLHAHDCQVDKRVLLFREPSATGERPLVFLMVHVGGEPDAPVALIVATKSTVWGEAAMGQARPPSGESFDFEGVLRPGVALVDEDRLALEEYLRRNQLAGIAPDFRVLDEGIGEALERGIKGPFIGTMFAIFLVAGIRQHRRWARQRAAYEAQKKDEAAKQ